jgi:hypothetical protein
MQHFVEWQAIGGLELGANCVGDREQTALRDFVERDAE